VHGVQTTLRSERRYKHFNLLDQLLRKEFGSIVPQGLPAKRAFGNLHPNFVEERRAALENYLQQCVAIQGIATSSLFCNFVEANVLPDTGGKFEEEETRGLVHQSLHRVCTKQGPLLKKGRRRASWKRRHFCLCDSELFYYYTAEMCNPFQPLGVISLIDSGGSSSRSGQSFDSHDGLEASGGGAQSPRPPVIIQPHCVGDSTLPRHCAFAIHTSGRTW